MRKLVLVSSILICTWLALGMPSLAAEKPGIAKGGRISFQQQENKAAGGTCLINCGNGWEYFGETQTLSDCTCACVFYCGAEACLGWEVGTENYAYCELNQN